MDQTELALEIDPQPSAQTKSQKAKPQPAAEAALRRPADKIPRVYSYPGIVSLTGQQMPAKQIEIGDWEFLFNSASTSKQINKVVLRPMHLRVLFSVCSIAREQYRSIDDALDFFFLPPVLEEKWLFGPNDVYTFNCSMRELWRRMGNAGAPSATNRAQVLGCVEDLSASPIRLRPRNRHTGDDGWIVRKLIHGWGEDCRVSKATGEPIRRGVSGLSISVSKNLLFLIERQYSSLHLDVFNGFTSDLARLIYLHYVPRAAGKDSYCRSLEAMYQEFGMTCPSTPGEQSRPLKRARHDSKAPIEQLNGCRTLYGTLSARLRDGTNGPVLVLEINEPTGEAADHKPGVLEKLWVDNGGTLEEWAKRLKRRRTLRVGKDEPDADPYIANLWPTTGIGDYTQYRDCIEIGIAIIGSARFRELVGVIASHQREGRKPTKSRLHQLIYEIKEAVASAARS